MELAGRCSCVLCTGLDAERRRRAVVAYIVGATQHQRTRNAPPGDNETDQYDVVSSSRPYSSSRMIRPQCPVRHASLLPTGSALSRVKPLNLRTTDRSEMKLEVDWKPVGERIHPGARTPV